MTEEFGDFSHHRPVLLHDDRAEHVLDTAALTAAATTTAERYFDMGYPGIAWKITEGTGYEDVTWRAAYATAVRRGRWFLGYHFDRAAFDGAAQFDWFISKFLAGAGGSLRGGGMDRLCLDSEDVNTPSKARQSALAFTRRAVQRGYPTGCIYSAPWYDSYTRPATVRLDLLPAGWQWGWVSDYTTGQADTTIELPAGWPRGKVWARQYTSTKPGLPGLPMGCDFNRTLQPWPVAAAGPTEPTEPSEEDQLMAASDDILAAIAAVGAKVDGSYKLLSVGDGKDVPQGQDTHPWNLKNVLAGQAALSSLVGAGDDAIEASIEKIHADPQVPNDDPAVFARAVVADLRDTLIAGTAGQG